MPKFVALLRAVNVGGTGKIPMADLKRICIEAGFEQVQTYIASGNVVFYSKLTAAKVKNELENRLLAYASKPVGVLVRTASEITAVLVANPFPTKPPNQTVVFFLDEPPPSDTLDHIRSKQEEEIRLGVREIYVFYVTGIGNTKLQIPAAKNGTARNMNTVSKLVQMMS